MGNRYSHMKNPLLYIIWNILDRLLEERSDQGVPRDIDLPRDDLEVDFTHFDKIMPEKKTHEVRGQT